MNKPFFQAIGKISGTVMEEDKKLSIAIDEQKFPLIHTPDNFNVYYALLCKIREGEQPEYLIVYPHFVVPHVDKSANPKAIVKRPQPTIMFVLVSFDSDNFDYLTPNQFLLKGVYQSIPKYKTPVITIYRNDTQELREQLKSESDNSKKFLLKPKHIPVNKITDIKPYRFSRNKGENAPSLQYLQIVGNLIPQSNTIEFASLLEDPTTEIPRYLKPAQKNNYKGKKKKSSQKKKQKSCVKQK